MDRELGEGDGCVSGCCIKVLTDETEAEDMDPWCWVEMPSFLTVVLP